MAREGMVTYRGLASHGVFAGLQIEHSWTEPSPCAVFTGKILCSLHAEILIAVNNPEFPSER